MALRGSQSGSLVALGFFLARRGATAAMGLGLSLLFVLGFGALSILLARRHEWEALARVPLLASSALAYGVGVLVAFAVSTRMFRRDEDDGVRELLRSRGIGPFGYLAARVVGLSMALAILVGGGSVLVGVVSMLVSHARVPALHTLQASLAAVVFGVAFAVTFAPVAMATLGARSRGGGYLALLAVLVIPELLRPTLDRLVAPRWLEVLSIPGALASLRASIAPVGFDLFMFGRAAVVLVAIILLALLIVRAELRRPHGTRRSAGESRYLA